MKRLRRVWWTLGTVALAVVLGAWMLLPVGGVPRVSLTLVGWTNSTELVSTNEFAPESARRPKRLALVRIANEDSARYSIGGMWSEEFYDRGEHPVKQRVELFLWPDSRLVSHLEAGASFTAPISVGDDGLPWLVSCSCVREARHTGIVRFLTPYVPLTWINGVMKACPLFEEVAVQLRSATNQPRADLMESLKGKARVP